MNKITYTPPRFILFMGWPGSGKSTLAKELTKTAHIFHIDNDAIRTPIFGEDRESQFYKTASPKTYEAMYQLAELNLQSGNSVLIEVPHIRLSTAAPQHEENYRQRERVRKIVEETGSLLKIMFAHCPTDETGTQRDAPKLANWETYIAKEIIPFTPESVLFNNVLSVNVLYPMEHNLGIIQDYLESKTASTYRNQQ
jgi:predicted kinase